MNLVAISGQKLTKKPAQRQLDKAFDNVKC